MTSIGTRIARIQTWNFSLFVVAVCVALTVVGISRYAAEQHSTEQKQLAAVTEIGALLAESRIAEADLLYHDYEQGVATLAQRNRELNVELAVLAQYSVACDYLEDLQKLQRARNIYIAQQQRWAKALPKNGLLEGGREFHGALSRDYRRADEAADALITKIARISDLRATRALRVQTSITVVLILLAGLGGSLSLIMMRSFRGRIIEPLTGITESLSKLASGNVNIIVCGSERPDEIGALARALEVFRVHAHALESAHSELREALAEAENLTRNDVLTGLPNRRKFVDTLTYETQHADLPCAVLLIDLDRFKPINDVYGHEAGDMVLCELANRFVAHRGVLGSVARLGGDEFAVIVSTAGGVSEATKAAQLIRHLVAMPIEIAGTKLEVGATIGIALFPKDGSSSSALLRAADLAMYSAKAKHRTPIQFFATSMHEHIQQRALLDNDLRRAIAADEIRPYYQPLVSLESGAVVGFEILTRWHHPSRGLIMPDQFIHAADERGLLTELTYRILRRACEDARGWPKDLTLSLNLAPSQLSDPLLAKRLMAILTQTGMAPARIEIEVTEDSPITDLTATKTLLLSLQDLGMTVSLDDFGTGYASLYQLRDLQFDKIKVDRSFVARLGVGGEAHVIVQAMIGLGKGLGLKTTAEGIENAAQAAQLAEWGCDYGQGYLYGKAMPAEEISALLHLQGRPILGSRSVGQRKTGSPTLAIVAQGVVVPHAAKRATAL